MAASTSETVSACPCCGAYTGTTLAQSPALLAVCDVLVVRALEATGKRIVRSNRGRFDAVINGGLPWHMAHTRWKPDQRMVDRALAGAWDVVPAMLSSHGCCGVNSAQVTRMLDQYVRDLLITLTPHQLGELRYRFEKYLGIPLPVIGEPYEPADEGAPAPLGVVGHGH